MPMRSDHPLDPNLSLGSSRGLVRGSWLVFAACVLIAGLVAGVVSQFLLSDSLAVLGIPNPGVFTTFGYPFLRATVWVLIALVVGSFATSAFFVSPVVPEKDNSKLLAAPLTVDGFIASRTGAWAALLVAGIALVEAPLVMSDLTGSPVWAVLNRDMFALAISQIVPARVWLITSLIAAVVALAGFLSRRWAAQPPLFFLAIALIIPTGIEGHSASGGDHDLGTNSLLWHLVFMTLWLGGLLGIIAHQRRLGPDLEIAVRRYSGIALAAAIVMVSSGIINAALRLQPADWVNTAYGRITLAKLVLTVVLVGFGVWHRQATIPQLAARPQLFRWIATMEVFVLAATAGVAVTMGRTPPPPPRDPNLSSMQILLGYNLEVSPTWLNVWAMFRFDLMFGTLGLVLAAAYGYALYKNKQRGLDWSAWRTTWFMLGALSLTVIMSTGIGMYIPALYSMHMLGHMVLSMVIPLFLVLGAPLTLVMQAFEPGQPGTPNLHDWVVAFVHSKTLRYLTHPVVNLLQFLVVFYALYLSFDFYHLAISEHTGHVLMNWAFLVSGYVYFWEVVGPDPLPHRRPTLIRLGVLFASMPIHLFMGVYLMQLNEILGVEYYQQLGLPWNPDLLADQR
ncbi:MAG: cytochrome c oxidase assembly protein, partial [Corynebacterium sp.]|nr:cytochrome c oxidase assembly protein [Corynebacterium sp.]